MESVPVDVLINLSSQLSIGELLNLCETNTNIKKLCKRPELWIKRLEKDYGIKYSHILEDKFIKNKNPGSVYKQIYENSMLCKNLIKNMSPEEKDKYFLDSFKDPELFYNQDDYYVFLYLTLKILNESFGNSYFKGYYNRFIEKINDKYNGVINSRKILSLEELLIYEYICLYRIKNLEDIQKSIFYRMFSEIEETSIPIVTKWKDMCEYNIFR